MLIIETPIHRSAPKTIGFQPKVFKFFKGKPEPTKNSETIRNFFEITTIFSPITDGIETKLFRQTIPRKTRINHGIFTLPPLGLKSTRNKRTQIVKNI